MGAGGVLDCRKALYGHVPDCPQPPFWCHVSPGVALLVLAFRGRKLPSPCSSHRIGGEDLGVPGRMSVHQCSRRRSYLPLLWDAQRGLLVEHSCNRTLLHAVVFLWEPGRLSSILQNAWSLALMAVRRVGGASLMHAWLP